MCMIRGHVNRVKHMKTKRKETSRWEEGVESRYLYRSDPIWECQHEMGWDGMAMAMAIMVC